MKAIVFERYGSAEVLELREIDKPTPKDNEILIQVRAASANALDWHRMRGEPYLVRMDGSWRRPKDSRLGADLAGVVEAVGSEITLFKVGDEVFGSRTGAFGEYVVTQGSAMAPKPAHMTFEQAAAVPVAALTALQGLRDKGRVQSGQSVLINGAGGGVGTFAVQIARAFGAEVTAVTSSAKLELVRSLGATHIIDYTREDFTRNGQRYDLVLDVGGGHSLSDIRRALTPQGTLVVAGGSGDNPLLGPLTGILQALIISRFVSQNLLAFIADANRDDLLALKELIESGKVTPVIDRTYPLEQVPEAITYLEQGHARGKVVVTVA